MTSEEWEQIKELFIKAEGLDGSELDSFRDRECPDPELRAALDRLLRQNKLAANFLQEPIAKLSDSFENGALSPGEVLGNRFIIESLLGAGGMGQVYRARDSRLQRLVAVKVLPAHATSDLERRRRLEREARAVAALSHPNICSLYDLDTDGQRDYLVFEYLVGETLASKLQRGCLPLNECLRIGNDITSALEYAHSRGVVHRDLKPTNVMLTITGAIKLLDFGIARQQRADSHHELLTTTQTAEGTLVGTPAYMSPEQAEGMPVDARSDIFSFGCVLYEMITGKRAFQGNSQMSTLAAIIKSEPTPIRELIAFSPVELSEIVVRCLRKDPNDRYPTMADVKRDLYHLAAIAQSQGGEWQGSSRPAAAAEGPREGTGRALWRHPVIAAVMVVTLLVVCGTGLLYIRRQLSHTVGNNSVVVLPFVNATGDAELEYLADGLSESITNTLSRLPAVRVIARTTAFSYKGQNVEVQKIRRDLNVHAIVTGKIARTQDEIQMQTDLIDASDGGRIWGQRYTTTIGNTLSVQQDIVQNLTSRLDIKLTNDDKKELSRHSTSRSDAYDSYLRGRHALARSNVPDIQKGIVFFQSALQADPTYAVAYTGLAECYWGLSGNYLKPAEAMLKAKAAAERALAIDPTLAEAHMSQGIVRGWYEFDLEQSARALKHATELNPNDASATLWYGWNLLMRGRVQEGIAQAKRAHTLDPLSPFVETGLGQMLSYAGKHEAAIRQLHSVIASDPNFFPGHHYLGTTYIAAKQYSEAARSFEQARKLDPSQPMPIAYLAFSRSMLRDGQAAGSLVRELTALSNKRYVSGTLFAIAALGLGGDDEAVKWLEKAYEDRDDMLVLIGIDRLYDRLRPDSRFEALRRKIGVPTVRPIPLRTL